MKRNIFQKQDDSEITEPVEPDQDQETVEETDETLRIRDLSANQPIL